MQENSIWRTYTAGVSGERSAQAPKKPSENSIWSGELDLVEGVVDLVCRGGNLQGIRERRRGSGGGCVWLRARAAPVKDGQHENRAQVLAQPLLRLSGRPVE